VPRKSFDQLWFEPYFSFHCDDCGSDVGYRTRTFSERYLLPLCLLQPVRCGECFRRDYRPIFMPLRERSTFANAKPSVAAPAPIRTRNVA
jgi:hypothetical protein